MGEARGSVYLLDQEAAGLGSEGKRSGRGKEVRLKSYERLQEPRDRDEGY